MVSPKPRTDSGLSNQAFRGLLWLMSGGVLTSILRLVNLIVLARLLSPAEFGHFSGALVFVGLSAVFAELGFGPAVIQKIDLSAQDKHAAYTLSIVLGLSLFAFSLWSAPIIGTFFNEPVITELIQILSVVFIFRGVGALSNALLERRLAFGRLVQIELGAYFLANFLPTIGFALAGFGVWALAIGYIVEAFAKTCALMYLNRGDIGISTNVASVRHLMRFGIGHSLARIFNYAANQGDFAVVGRLLGPSALGEYSRAYQIMASPTQLVGQATSRVLFPTFAKIQKDKESLKSHYKRSLSVSAIVCFPIAAFLVVMAENLVTVMLGTGWDGVVVPMQVLACVLVFRTGYKMSDSLAIACGAVYSRAVWQFVYAGSVGMGAFAGAAHGIPGVAAGVAAAIALNYVLMANLCRKLTGASVAALLHSHVPGLILGCASMLACETVLRIGSVYELSALTNVFLAVLVTPVVIVAVIRVGRVMLGSDLEWFLSVMFRNIPGYLQVAFCRVIGWRPSL